MSQQSSRKSDLTPVAAAAAGPLGDHMFFYFVELAHSFKTTIEVRLQEFELDFRQYVALAFIVDGHGPTQQNLAQLLRLDPSQVVKLVKELDARGLIIRHTRAQDRRAKALAITAEGRRLYAQAAVAVRRVEETLTDSLSRRDVAALGSLLNRLIPLA